MSLAWIPIGVTSRVKNICRIFLWRNQEKDRNFAWIAWDRISIPKQWGGLGIKDLHLFSNALAAKLCWHLITGCSLWKELITAKYIAAINTIDWIRGSIVHTPGGSIIWKAITKAAPLIQSRLSWKIGTGDFVRVGTNSWSGSGDYYKLPAWILEHLASLGIRYLTHIADQARTNWHAQSWLSVKDLDIPRDGRLAWSTSHQGFTSIAHPFENT